MASKEAVREDLFDSFWNHELKLAFDDIADLYDAANDFFSFGVWERTRKRFVDGIRPREDSHVLDVCAGTNAVGIDLLKKNPTLQVTAVDRSEAMQQIGAEKADKLGLNIQSVISDAHSLPFEDDTFDVVTLEAATRHLRVDKAFAEIFRVLKPSGTFHHCDLVKPTHPLVTKAYFAYLRLMIPITTFLFFRAGDFFNAKSSVLRFRDYFIDAIDQFYTAEELTDLLETAGFSGVRMEHRAGGTIGLHRAEKAEC